MLCLCSLHKQKGLYEHFEGAIVFILWPPEALPPIGINIAGDNTPVIIETKYIVSELTDRGERLSKTL